ncbi:unnamed protein product [Symbiodinium sp. CCMP2592]|nr:unnamed protein product [Symbiodinium sp. CCMP2592]
MAAPCTNCALHLHQKATPQHLAQLLLWHLGKAAVVPHLAALCDNVWAQPGGVTLSIDTSKAFDTVNRQVLEHELRAAHVPEPELDIILHLHHCIGYWPAGQDPTTRVASERGVRQGCPLAPSLWTLITVALFRALAGVTSVTWLQEDATMYADDLLLQWVFHRVQDLEHMVSTIEQCFRILAQLGLQVQHRKMQLIVAYKGRQAKQWWRAHTASTSEGRSLLIPQPGRKALRLPIVTQLTYLGIVLSYVDATTATVEHRLQVAEAQRARLLKVLHSRTLPLTKRVQLWLACVRSFALYGLHLVDLQQRRVARITVTLVRHLRAIARSFARMTQESSKAPRIVNWLVHVTESKLALTSHLDQATAGPSASAPPSQNTDFQTVETAVTSPPYANTALMGCQFVYIVARPPGEPEQRHTPATAAVDRTRRTPGPRCPGQSQRTLQDAFGRSRTAPPRCQGPHRSSGLYLSRLQSDHTVIFTFRTGNGPQLMVPLLQEVAATWREQCQQNKVTRSLKQTLIQYLAAEIVTRVTAFATDKESQAKAQELGWITSEMEYNVLDQILADARRLKTLLKHPAAEAMAIFRKWYANSALLLLSLRLKPARPERSPLIKEIQEAVGW